MPTTTRAYFQREPNGALELDTVTLGDPKPHSVRVRITATGVCQSQIYWMSQPRPEPLLFGHEGHGIVEEVGSAVTRVAAGDSVLVTWLPGERSATRAPERTEAVLADGSTAFWSNVNTWAEHTVVDEEYLIRLPAEITDPAIGLVGCAVPTGAGAVINAADVRAGDAVAVIGLGGVGLSAVVAAAARDAAVVYAVDIAGDKLEFARHFGASHTVDSTTTDLAQIAHTSVVSRTGLPGFDKVIDCVGSTATINQSIAAVHAGRVSLHRGGVVVVVGVPKGDVPIDAIQLLTQEKSLLGTLGGSCTHEQLNELCRWSLDGRLDLGRLVTDRYGFDDLPKAVEALRAGKILGRALVTM
ncbi:zinc-binding dehydrogenase [Nocardia flavorosea]|uniref:Zinc-binding dehydrogenase n=1 Tax=Nocardia flavorosea TaxID=53429 RepID=A0A846YJN4_9NOCA|nr:zinc-binding dehydrogenase [Nocardia flavorosea]NKY57328.1 zinc-binding dehydrogenase [Nocardia flavorosea]